MKSAPTLAACGTPIPKRSSIKIDFAETLEILKTHIKTYAHALKPLLKKRRKGRTMKVGVRVMLKKEVLDVEGRAVADTLKREGTIVSDCRVGKYIVLDIPTQDFAEAKAK